MSQEIGITNIFYDLRQVREVNDFKLKTIHKLVLFILESRGKKIYPTKKTIAEDCGCSKATIDKAIKELQSADLIKVKRKFNSSNWYFINKKAIHEEANKLRLEESNEKELEEAYKDPDYDPWEEEFFEEQNDDAFYKEMDLSEPINISNEEMLEKMWDSLNSISKSA
jgi:DNA-binding MarR family transcriptional regulator